MKKALLYPTALLFAVFMMASGVSAAQSSSADQVATAVIGHGNAALPFPPSFLGHPVAYAFALFGQLTIFIGALVVLFICVPNINLYAGRAILKGRVVKWRSLVNVYRVRWALMMVAVLLGVSGNLLTYLAWGEVSTETMKCMLSVDKVLKGLACFPFAAVVYMIIEHDEAFATQLSLAAIQPEPIVPPEPEIKEHYKTLGLIMLAVVLITYGKASGLGV